jgi:hypothetical protein
VQLFIIPTQPDFSYILGEAESAILAVFLQHLEHLPLLLDTRRATDSNSRKEGKIAR